MSKDISIDEVKQIAKLARIGITEAEAKQITKNLGGILDHFSQIQNIDTKDIPTSDDITGLRNITRDDAAEPNSLCSPKELMDAAPGVHQGQIKVKAVFKQ